MANSICPQHKSATAASCTLRAAVGSSACQTVKGSVAGQGKGRRRQGSEISCVSLVICERELPQRLAKLNQTEFNGTKTKNCQPRMQAWSIPPYTPDTPHNPLSTLFGQRLGPKNFCIANLALS